MIEIKTELLKPVHPFPARMAPDVAYEACRSLEPGMVVLDPMVGSGTTARIASSLGLTCLGTDLDPLAVLISRVWTRDVDPELLRGAAGELIARVVEAGDVRLSWLDEDEETLRFVSYWFGSKQARDLRPLAWAIRTSRSEYRDVFAVALSRLIVRKDGGASLARDVSHSRPHRVRLESDFSVLGNFVSSVDWLAKRAGTDPFPATGPTDIRRGDARALTHVKTRSVDAVITSPPYLNAIDYMRGHKLSLVWLGYKIGALAGIRSSSVGAERGPDDDAAVEAWNMCQRKLGDLSSLPPRHCRMVRRYVHDVMKVSTEIGRTLKPGGTATIVVGNSALRGVFIRNDAAVRCCAELAGLQLVSERSRALPPSRRYLPPPTTESRTGINARLRTENVMTFARV